jgi:hypothetical protein
VRVARDIARRRTLIGAGPTAVVLEIPAKLMLIAALFYSAHMMPLRPQSIKYISLKWERNFIFLNILKFYKSDNEDKA